MCRKRDSHSREQYSKQSAKQHERLCPAECIDDRRTCLLDAHPTETRAEILYDLPMQLGEAIVWTCNQEPIEDPAARFYDFGCGHIVDTHQEPRTKVGEAATAIRFVTQYAGDAQIRNADGDRIAHRNAERREQA